MFWQVKLEINLLIRVAFRFGSSKHCRAFNCVVFSILWSSVAAFRSVLCWIRCQVTILSRCFLSSRFPKAGSAYTYAYVGEGSQTSFLIIFRGRRNLGLYYWLEHSIGAHAWRSRYSEIIESTFFIAVARSWSGYLDSLLGKAISNTTIERLGHLHVWKLMMTG